MPDQQQIGKKLYSQTGEASSNPEKRTKSTSSSTVGASNNCLNILDYFRSSANKVADNRVSRLLTTKIHNELNDIFTGIGCFEGTFMIQVREGTCLYQAPTNLYTPRTTMKRAGQTRKNSKS